MLILSSKAPIAVVHYPESGKVGIWTQASGGYQTLLDADATVDYWEGEHERSGSRSADRQGARQTPRPRACRRSRSRRRSRCRANSRRASRRRSGPVDEVHSVEDADADGVPVRIYRPVETDEPSTALVYFHGGGFVAGQRRGLRPARRARSRSAPAASSISVDYRLAPEHPYPAALDDAWTATKWVTANAERARARRWKIGVGGDSAGGALAAIVARKGRDHGIAFAVQLLLYPITSSDQNTPSYSLYS